MRRRRSYRPASAFSNPRLNWNRISPRRTLELRTPKLILASYRTESPQTAYTAAKAAAAKALALNESLPDAHATYTAAVLFYEWDWSSAREHLSRAAALGETTRICITGWRVH